VKHLSRAGFVKVIIILFLFSKYYLLSKNYGKHFNKHLNLHFWQRPFWVLLRLGLEHL